MSILTKILEQKREQDEWVNRREREADEKERKLGLLDYNLYCKLRTIMMELDGQTIEKHKIIIQERNGDVPSRTLFMFVDGKPHIKLSVKRDCRACDCGAHDGMCDHENIYTRTITIKDYGWAANPNEYGLSLNELQEQEINEDSMARCILRWIDDYERRY